MKGRHPADGRRVGAAAVQDVPVPGRGHRGTGGSPLTAPSAPRPPRRSPTRPSTITRAGAGCTRERPTRVHLRYGQAPDEDHQGPRVAGGFCRCRSHRSGRPAARRRAIRRPYSSRKTRSTAAVPRCIDQSTFGQAQARPSNGRTSTLPRYALDPSAASLSATSRPGASMTQKPSMTSLVSR